MRLKDRVAVITGGASGIGEGICLCMAREGAHVVIGDINMESSAKVADKILKTGRKVLTVKTDVRKMEDCQNLIKKSLDDMGCIDILICCSGFPGYSDSTTGEDPTRIENISEDNWNLTIDTNLKGVFLCNRSIAPYFKQNKKGKIINIASIAGRRGADWIPHYSASKAGVIVMSQAIAAQLAPFNVNVNTICPGFIWTPMSLTAGKMMAELYPQFNNMNPDEVFNELVRTKVPLGRPQTPEAIGNLAVFLASDEANEITGQAINVDGGAVFS